MEFTTIATYTLPHEAAIPKALLESEGINCYLRNETTIQSYNFYSNAVGGITLQVKTEDAERALEILRIGGFLGKEKIAPEENSVLTENPEPWKTDPEAVNVDYTDTSSADVKRMHPLVKAGTVVLIITIGVSAFFVWRSMPKEEPIADFNTLLTQHKWKIDQLMRTKTSKTKYFFPAEPIGLPVQSVKSRSIDSVKKEEVTFGIDGKLNLPEVGITTTWNIKQDTLLTVGKMNSVHSIYPGTYTLKLINDYNIVLETDTLSIFLLRQL